MFSFFPLFFFFFFKYFFFGGVIEHVIAAEEKPSTSICARSTSRDLTPEGRATIIVTLYLYRSSSRKALSMSSSSTAVRVFRGCRALLGPARSSASAAKPSKASATGTTASSAKEKPKARKKSSASSPPRSTPSRPSGIQKVTPVSPALAEFLQCHEASRSDAVKQIWSYIKLHDLQVLPPPPRSNLSSLFQLTYDGCFSY